MGDAPGRQARVHTLNSISIGSAVFVGLKARKLTYYSHTMKKQGSCLEKETMQETMPGARKRGRPRWIDNVKTWTGLSMEESVRMTEDRDTWRKYVHGVANPQIDDGYRTDRTRSQAQTPLPATLAVLQLPGVDQRKQLC